MKTTWQVVECELPAAVGRTIEIDIQPVNYAHGGSGLFPNEQQIRQMFELVGMEIPAQAKCYWENPNSHDQSILVYWTGGWMRVRLLNETLLSERSRPEIMSQAELVEIYKTAYMYPAFSEAIGFVLIRTIEFSDGYRFEEYLRLGKVRGRFFFIKTHADGFVADYGFVE